MANRSEILTPVWGIGLQGYGTVVTDMECIRQRIDIAIRTTKGSDPMRPEFGSNIYKYQDAPIPVAVPNIKSEILTAVGLWVPDVKVISITTSTDISSGQITFFIVYELVNQDIIDSIQLGIGGGIITSGGTALVVQDVIPSKIDTERYLVNMILNAVAATPTCSLFGYGSIDELFLWVQNNWGYLADWSLMATAGESGKKLVGYIKDKVYTSGLLDVGKTALTRVATGFPDLPFGERYQTTFTPAPETDALILEGNLYDPQALLLAAQDQWADYGTWVIESISGDFNGDFGGDFNATDLLLVLYTYSNPTAQLLIEAV